MVVAAFLVLGWRARQEMPAELNPAVDIPYVTIQTVYAGAGPEEVETLITKPIEDAVGSVNGIKNLTSTSQEGISVISLEFYLGTNVDVAAADVRQRVEQAKSQLPREVDSPVVSKLDINAQPIMYLGLTSDRRPSKELRDLADNVLQYRISQIPGVGSVNVSGGDKREIRVAIDRERLAAYGLTIQNVTDAIASQNLNLPGGHISEGARDYSVRLIGEFSTVDQLRHLRMQFAGKGSNGKPVTLNLTDIATVTDTVSDRDSITRTQGLDSIGLTVVKQSDANTVETADGVKEVLLQLTGQDFKTDDKGKLVAGVKPELPSDIRFTMTQDQSKNVKAALNDVNLSLFLGALLAVMVVFIFLHNLRGTFIVAMAIPTSIIATFIPIHALGFTLNQMTMLALSLVVGILVDDSIVVLENIYRHLMRGEGPKEAAVNGRSEIGTAAVAITLVDVVVFVPIAFMGGIVGRFFRQFGLTVAFATLFSLFMSFTFTPMLASRWYRAGEDVEVHSGVFGAFNRFYAWLDGRYRRLLAWGLEGNRYWRPIDYLLGGLAGIGIAFLGLKQLVTNLLAGNVPGLVPGLVMAMLGGVLLMQLARGIRGGDAGRGARRRLHNVSVIMMGVIALVISLAWGMPKLGFQFIPAADQGQVVVTAELPAGSSLEATDATTKDIERILRTVPEVEKVFTNVGSISGGVRATSETGRQFSQIQVKLKDKRNTLDMIFRRGQDKRTRADQDVAVEFRKRLSGIPGAKIVVAPVRGFGGAEAPLQIELSGVDLERMTSIGDKIRDRMGKIPGVLNPDISIRVGKPEIQVKLDRLKAAEMGVDVRAAATALRSSIEGNTDAKFREKGEQYDIHIRYTEDFKNNVDQIPDVIVGNKNGRPVTLRDIATIDYGSGPTKIDRKNRLRKVLVSAYTAPGVATGNLQQVVDKAIADIPLGDVKLNWAGEIRTMNEEFGYLVSAMGLAIVLVYMLMAAVFNSLLHPFTILLSLPMALVGAVLALVIGHETLSIIALIGFIMLVGLVMKNAILLIDYTNTLRSRGLPRDEALLEAGPTRLRPIMMTSIAMIFGMLPTALRIGEANEFRAPMAIAVIGGLILSTLLTLLVIPMLYTLFDEAITGFQGFFYGPPAKGKLDFNLPPDLEKELTR
jgi:HAE1 family hydrophobic/amphiphilic exporter-1